MKTANVVSVQDRGPLTATAVEADGTARVSLMADLLRRYPDIEDEERRQLLEFLTSGPQDEIVQVTYLQGLEPKLSQFRKNHPRQFRAGLSGWLPMIIFIAVAVIGLIWRLSS